MMVMIMKSLHVSLLLVSAVSASYLCLVVLLSLYMGHFTFWISLSLSEIAKHTHRPQGVNYHMSSNIYYYYILYLNRKP